MPNVTREQPASVDHRIDSLQEKLSAQGFRVTPQRIHVLRALLLDNRHPTAEQVWDNVRKISPSTSLATIYKTLDTLSEIGEVLKIETRDHRAHYDAAHPKAHPHVICRNCGKIEDVAIQNPQQMLSEAMAASGYRLDEQQVTFFGLCRNCAA